VPDRISEGELDDQQIVAVDPPIENVVEQLLHGD
jgi:hypothetical protein